MSVPPEQPAYANYPSMPPVGHTPQPQRRSDTNGYAIAALVTGILGFTGAALVSVGLAIVALVGIGRTGQRGKGMAITGLVLSVAWLALFATLFTIGFTQGLREAAAQQPGTVNTFSLEPGQCFDRDEASKSAYVQTVECAKPHDAEAFAVVPLAGNTFPGVDSVQQTGSQQCGALSLTWLTRGLNYPDFAVHYIFPEPLSWNKGVRADICFYRSDKGKITGHVKDQGVPFTADQKHYLAVTDPYLVLRQEERGSGGKPWSDQRDLAARTVPVLQKEITQLQAGPWPTVVQTWIDKFVSDKQRELGYRQQAAAGGDQNTVLAAVQGADNFLGLDEDQQIRHLLNLNPG